MRAFLSSLALAALLCLSTLLPHDAPVVSGDSHRGAAAPAPSSTIRPPHVVMVVIGACVRACVRASSALLCDFAFGQARKPC